MAIEGQAKFRKFNARHPHWKGSLLLSQISNEVVHGERQSRGKYEISGNELHVKWDDFANEVYHLVAGTYFQAELIQRMDLSSTPMDSISYLNAYGIDVVVTKISVLVPGVDCEVTLRSGTSDIPTFGQIFCHKEYESPNLPLGAKKIVDLGANIGLGTIFFGTKYPAAELLSVEPDKSNYTLLEANTHILGDRVIRREGAVWIADGTINLHVEGEDGKDLGAWGRQVSEFGRPSSQTTPCYKLKSLIDDAGFDFVDILKIDIEGAEFELFSHNLDEWIHRVNLIIVETHDRFRPGADKTVRSALSLDFRELPSVGENLFFIRR